MNIDNMLLDFTSPGAIPPDPTELAGQAINSAQTAIHTLEQLLETERIEDTAGWRLLAMFYLTNGRTHDLAKIEKRYQALFGKSLSADLKKKYALWFKESPGSEAVTFAIEMPVKITAATLPDNEIIRRECRSSGGVVVDFSQVQEIDTEGLRKLGSFFSVLANENTKPVLKQVDRFMMCLQKKAEEQTGMHSMWDVLFAYDRFREDKDAFDERAIRFAVHYGISPPSWE